MDQLVRGAVKPPAPGVTPRDKPPAGNQKGKKVVAEGGFWYCARKKPNEEKGVTE